MSAKQRIIDRMPKKKSRPPQYLKQKDVGKVLTKFPGKVPVKKKLLPQTPVGMANAQTSAKFVPNGKNTVRNKPL